MDNRCEMTTTKRPLRAPSNKRISALRSTEQAGHHKAEQRLTDGRNRFDQNPLDGAV